MRAERAAGILVALFFILAAPALAADSFTAEIITVDESILPGDSALYEILVTNTHSTEDRYTVSSGESSYIIFIEERPGEIEPNGTGTFEVEVNPRSFVGPGSHRVPLNVRSQQTGETERLSPIIFIQDPETSQGEYVPSIALSVNAPSQVDPKDGLTLHVALRNRNNRLYDRNDPITVVVESDIFHQEYQTQLGPVGLEGEKTNEINIDLDPYQEPGVHPLNVQVRVRNATVSEQTLQFEILAFSEIETVMYDDDALFRSSTIYRVRNDGNVPDTAVIQYPINPLQRLFVSSSHNFAFERIDDQLHVVVEQPLEPLGEADITITENYRLLVLLILLVVASLIGYFLLRSPVVLGKEAVIGGAPQEGVSEIKVRIFVKNRSSKTMRHLRVIDRISGMADIVKQDSLGTLQPTKVVKKEGQGTLLRWDLDQLEPFEERIISYKARTPLKLVGDVTLPAVKVKFDVPSGRERTAHSNEVSITRPE